MQPCSIRQTLLNESAALLAVAKEKLDLAACDIAAVRTADVLDMVRDLLAVEEGQVAASRSTG